MKQQLPGEPQRMEDRLHSQVWVTADWHSKRQGLRGVHSTRDRLRIENDDAAWICVSVGSTPDEDEARTKALLPIAMRFFPRTLEAHIEDHRVRFSRLLRALGTDSRGDTPTRERWEAVRQGAEDPGLATLLSSYGQYLLRSTRPEPAVNPKPAPAP